MQRLCFFFFLIFRRKLRILAHFLGLLSKCMEQILEKDLQIAVETIQNGGVILYPTDTIWGIGCDARNEKAVQRIFQIKKRQEAKTMLLLASNWEQLQKVVGSESQKAKEIIQQSNRPTTIIYPKAKNIVPQLIAEDGSVGVRITAERFSCRLCELVGFPIVSTSANISGEFSPRVFSEISEEIKAQVDYVVKYRREDTFLSKSSKILKLQEDTILIIRE